MKTLVVTVFGINELSEEVRAEVVERYRRKDEWCWDYIDSHMLTEDFQYELQGTMFEDCEVEWSLSNCQGDGVRLVGDVDRDKLYDFLVETDMFGKHDLRRLKFVIDNSKILLKRSMYGSYHNIVEVDDLLPWYYRSSEKNDKLIDSLLETIEEMVKQEADRVCCVFENQGYLSIDYAYTDERIIERLEADGYEFYEDGRDF